MIQSCSPKWIRQRVNAQPGPQPEGAIGQRLNLTMHRSNMDT